ncbi:proton-coupled zinc antiporter SLC30A2-like [Convolutriloba macropyga]|uniref:proton-coupled zinc antiporter SLC30A2-like n=1 Tax=Convolutriloba macropyga TaxID=536237 RepID=UPI003F521713
MAPPSKNDKTETSSPPSSSGDDGKVSNGKHDLHKGPEMKDADHCHTDLNVNQSESNAARNKLLLASSLVLVFMVCEFVGGFLANSLAIMTDAFHLLSDFAGFCISLFAIWFATRPATKNMSFGYYRAEVLGAVISVLLIWVLTGVLVYMAILRVINQDYEIDADVMLITAACGLAVNVVLGVVLYQADIPHDIGGFGHSHGHDHSHGHSLTHSEKKKRNLKDLEARGFLQPNAGYNSLINDDSNATLESDESLEGELAENRNINVRAAFIHCLGDLVQSTGVLIAATIIKLKPDWILADPICTFFFSILVLFTTLTIMRDAVQILMEGKPAGYEYDQIMEELMAIPGVRTVHNLHVWSLSIEKVAISVHLTIEPEADQEQILRESTKKLKSNFQFSHTTVQVEHYIPSVMDDCKQCVGPSK